MSVWGNDSLKSGDDTKASFVVVLGGQSGYQIDETQGSDNKYALNVFVVSGSVIGGGGAGGGGAVSGFVALSGGSVSISGNVTAKISGEYVNLAASGVGLSHYSGALNINISGGTISTTPPAYQSGTLVGISGGNLALSGLSVSISGNVVVSDSGSITRVMEGTSGQTIGGTSGADGKIALNVFVVSGSVIGGGGGGGGQVSGTVAISGQVIITSGGVIPNQNFSIASGQTTPIRNDIGYFKTKVSGGATLTIVSGISILNAVIPIIISGPQPTFSGQSIIINDATSGMGNRNSGTPVFVWDFGRFSGAIPPSDRDKNIPPVYNINIICSSGIVVSTGSGFQVTVVYNIP